MLKKKSNVTCSERERFRGAPERDQDMIRSGCLGSVLELLPEMCVTRLETGHTYLCNTSDLKGLHKTGL